MSWRCNSLNTPNLRFKEFNDEWIPSTMNEISVMFSGGTPKSTNRNFYNGKIPFIRSGEIHSDHTELFINEEALRSSSAKMVQKGDLLYALYGATSGEVDVSKIEGAINQAILCIKPNCNVYFLKTFLEYQKKNIINKFLQGGQGNLSASIIKQLSVHIPSTEEQEKITVFFKIIDSKIKLQQEKIDLLKEQKKGYMQNIFSQDFRFKDKNGRQFPNWKVYKLSDFSSRITRKNSNLETNRPLTISAQYGLIDQIEFFNKNVASSNLDGYYLLQKGEFAYNKSYSNGFPLGTIKRLDNYKDGALSTLYICFASKDNMNSDFLVHYFDSAQWHKAVSLICVEGARNHGLLNVSVLDFFDTEHQLPCKEEQIEIAHFFNLINEKIDLNEEKLKNLKNQKQALMQQMFI